MSVGEVKRSHLYRLLEALVHSVSLYGAGVWGCCKQMGPLEKVQICAARIFWRWGVGTQEWLCSMR